MDVFLQQLINSLRVGSIYAVIALGYTMVYGIIMLINFAHGEIMMFGAYFAYLLAIYTPLPLIAIIIISMILAAGLGMLVEVIAYKPLRKAPRLSLLITAIGMSFFLQNLALAIWGSTPVRMPALINMEPMQVGNVTIDAITILTIGVSVVSMIALQVFVKKTKPGKAMRAVSEDKDAAALMGINVNSTISLTFAIGSGLGALGGILLSIAYAQVFATMGIMPGLKAFIAAVLGGIGIIPGAMIGGFAIGLIETMTKAYISSSWADGIVFAILIIVLLVKPTGVLGKNERDKV
jgi:branched-chain amino acid transport system permease protein